MKLLVLLTFCNLSVALGSTITSPPHALARRDETLPPVSFIMRDTTQTVDGVLPIYDVNGHHVYSFQRTAPNMNGESHTKLIELTASKRVLTMTSRDDFCLQTSHFVEDKASSNIIMINPRGIHPDRWSLTVKQGTTPLTTYDLVRNTWSKNGNIHLTNKEGPLVAKLTSEARYESWLNPGEAGVKTYTLHLNLDLDPLYFVTLMGLVLTRVANCGY